MFLIYASQGYVEHRAFDDDDSVATVSTQRMATDGCADFHTSSDNSHPSGDFVFSGDDAGHVHAHQNARACAARLLECMEVGAAGGMFVCEGMDERWQPGHVFAGSVSTRPLHHGDWRGQKLWRVPADTFRRSYADIVAMLKAAAVLCSQEPAVVQLQQPVHVFGDIHGNLNDLKYFESLLWPLGVSFAAGAFLWLGDYVDRGAAAVETIVCVSLLRDLMPVFLSIFHL